MKTLLRYTLFASLLLTGHLSFAAAADDLEDSKQSHLLSALSLVSSTTPGVQQNIRRKLEEVPTESMASLSESMRALFDKTKNARDMELIIDAINPVPIEDRTYIVTQINSIFRDRWSYRNQAKMITAINAIDRHERENVITIAQSFFTDQTPAFEKIAIIKNIGKTPQAERDDLLKEFYALFGNVKAGAGYMISQAMRLINETPAEEKESIFSRIKALFVDGMNDKTKIGMFVGVMTIYTQTQEDIVPFVQPLVQATNGATGCTQLVFDMERQPLASRQVLSDAIILFVSPQISEHDFGQIFQGFSLLATREGSDIVVNRANQVRQTLDRDIQSGRLVQAQVLSRILELIDNPDAPLVIRNLQVTGQEALTAERQPIYTFYRSVSNQPLMQEGLTSDKSFDDVASHVQTTITSVLEQDGLTPQQQFRYETMLEGLQYLGRIRSDFALAGLPNIQNVTRQLHHVLMHQPKPDLVRTHIINHWAELQSAFPPAAAFDSPGLFLPSPQGQRFEQNLRDTLDGKDAIFAAPLNRNMLRWIRTFEREAMAEPTDMERLAPLTEALFTIMRGHVAPGQMLNPEARHSLACADGVYLGLLRALQEVPVLAKAGAPVADVAVVNCGAA